MPAKKKRTSRPLRFTQVCAGTYRTSEGGLSFVPLALGNDGKVYKFLFSEGWVELEAHAEQAREDQTNFMNERDQW